MIDTNDPVVVQCVENFAETEGISELLYGTVNYTIQKDQQKAETTVMIQYTDKHGNKFNEQIALELE